MPHYAHTHTYTHTHTPQQQQQTTITGHPSSSEIKQQFITDNHIFTISHTHGVLTAEEHTIVRITYTHKHTGYHTLPLIFHVNSSKQIVLQLIGETVRSMPKQFKFLPYTCSTHAHTRTRTERKKSAHTHTYPHILTPMPLGLRPKSAPVQTVALVNTTQWDLQYDVDLSHIVMVCMCVCVCVCVCVAVCVCVCLVVYMCVFQVCMYL